MCHTPGNCPEADCPPARAPRAKTGPPNAATVATSLRPPAGTSCETWRPLGRAPYRRKHHRHAGWHRLDCGVSSCRHRTSRGKYRMRQMTLVAFLQAQNCTNFVGSWRHPEASPGFMTADYYRHIARVLEAGKFHVGFFDDRLAMPDRYGGDHAHTVANGIQIGRA